ncbi:hypothetical protein FACS1894219_03210 [Clostridia bacterium]|nr:hypothetical protein FACS1894219_03210 [Clostridia bacterium]
MLQSNPAQNTRLREILTSAVFVIILGGFIILNRVIIPPEKSMSERRVLDTMPAFNLESVASAEFMDKFENYAADSFAFRDGLRTLRAVTVFDVFFQTDKEGLFIGDSGAGKFAKVNEKSYQLAANKISKITDDFLGGLNVYYSIIPDKSIYSGKFLPGFDADKAAQILADGLTGKPLTYIDLTASLSGDMFYKTDLHWDQSKLEPVLDKLESALDITVTRNFTVDKAGEFEGVYRGQIALPLGKDTIYSMTNDAIRGAQMKYLDDYTLEMTDGEIYSLEKYAGDDKYDYFLHGPTTLIEITNPANPNGRELYIFRDSFTSSLAPLLISAYSKITLIDLRYLNSVALPMFVSFKPDSDALFLYSSQVLNNAGTLLVS